MADQLSVGKREVFTTASSLANRMGVVAGQTGDPVAIASSQLGKTLDTLAKRKLVQQEENWKLLKDILYWLTKNIHKGSIKKHLKL